MATLLTKALRSTVPPKQTIRKASRGTISSYVLGAPPEYGQPRPLQTDVLGLISPERMREVVMKTPTPAASVNAVLDFASGVPLKLRSTDVSQPINQARAKSNSPAHPPCPTSADVLSRSAPRTSPAG